jgi:TPP-dependent pyruvate/acetoin dehydrogenase alpha subunit
MASQGELEALEEDAHTQVHLAAQRAEAAPYPPASALLDCVYSENSI